MFKQRLGYLHRNIDAEKVFLSKKEGVVKLGDFGIAFLMAEENENYHFSGTKACASPEILQ